MLTGIIIVIIAAILYIIAESINNSLLGFISGATTMLGCIITFWHDSPQAIDVYRNKTALQITYKDNIPIDSVVVWK